MILSLTEKKYRQNVTLIIFCVKTGNPMQIILTAKERKVKGRTVFLEDINCRNGQKARHKNFSARQLVMKTKGIAATKKLNFLDLTN